MSRKNRPSEGVVYSTDPTYQYQYNVPEEQATLDASRQKLKVGLDKHARGGKQVTVVEGFVGTAGDLETLGKSLRTHCGVGGSAKDGQILLQGDLSEKASAWLTKQGYLVK